MNGTKLRPPLALLALLANILFPLPPLHADAAANLSLYGTFNAVGVIVTFSDAPDQGVVANIAYRVEGDESYRAGFPLSRVGATRFVGSLFWLQPGTAYDVRVTFTNPNGRLNGVTLAGTVSTRAEIVVPSPSRSYYVSPTGSGTACSLTAPCSLAYGLSQAQRGQAVVLRAGIYHEGNLKPPRSGAADAPIVIRSYPGERAILDGSDPDPLVWAAQGGGVYSTTIAITNSHLILSDGQRLYPYQSLADLQNLVWDISGFYASGTTVYVHLLGNADPRTTTMVVSRYHSAFTAQQNFIYFLDLSFRYYGLGHGPAALRFISASDNLVQGCTFADNDVGIAVSNAADRNVIQNNEFMDTMFDWAWDAVYDGPDLAGISGIVFVRPDQDKAGVVARGNVIRRNVFHDTFDGLEVCPDQFEGATTNETDVYENLIHHVGDDGIESEGLCSNVRIWGNTIHDVHSGISLAPARAGPVYAIRNLIYRIGANLESSYGRQGPCCGTAFKFNYQSGGSGPVYLFHNTADAALPNNPGIRINESVAWPLLVSRNNIWSGTLSALNYSVQAPIDFDYDDLWTSYDYLVRWRGTRYNTLRSFTAATGQERHGLSVDPRFVKPSEGKYSLLPSSPLTDAGVLIPGINDDHVGAAPDIGALEYGFSLRPRSPRRATTPGGVARVTVDVRPVGGFTATVALASVSPSASLTVELNPRVLTPPAQATLIVTDKHTGSSLLPGIWYPIVITAMGEDITQTTSVTLLVGGARVDLPILSKD